jgi:dTDP-4-dehydrorhamnose reductase
MTRVLVTGLNGQVARALSARWGDAQKLELIHAVRPEFEMARPDSLGRYLDGVMPDVVVNAAAYTAVDLAEDEPELARIVNADSPAAIARWCAQSGAQMIHLSTDYVYAGTGTNALLETEEVAPQNVYGYTKLAGEQAIVRALPRHVILRTAWVYSPYGKNFVKTMLALASGRPEIRVVADQFGNPTSALDIADAILVILNRWQEEPGQGLGQTYHVAGQGHANWAELASAIMTLSKTHGGPSADIIPISSSAFPTRARRPSNSRLDCGKFAREWGWLAPHWSQSLASVVEQLSSETR